MSFFEKLFGSFSDKELKRINPIKDKVLALEPEMAKLTDEQLQAKTAEFKERLAKGETLDDILPEAFAVCREADWRVLGMKPYPVQIIGGIVLHRACIAEMQTGEGKTLVATMPTYLNALTGEGVHVITVNDYLARRDSEWMGKVYRFLGLTVGLVVHGVESDDRKKAYEADVTYGTNNEFGFDYLRDNMVVYKANMVQRGHAFAIVDEVDSILIDEARTPLIISGKGEDSSVMYKRADDFAKTLKKSVIVELDDKVEAEEQVDGDYVVDEKRKTATLTESGVKKAEAFFHVDNLADADNMSLRHYVDGAIKARGFTGALLNVGGNLRAIGTKPGGKPWTAGVENPWGDDPAYIQAVELADGDSLVISGDYQRYFEYEGVRYAHLIDLTTGYPARYVSSVAVLAHAETGGLADALSTGLFCLPEQTGRTLADRNGWAVLWMHTDKSTAQSADWPQ